MRMTSYLDITLLPNHEVNRYFLWEKLYAQVHLALVTHKNHKGEFSIGVAFPEYTTRGLGNKLRIFATESHQLEQLDMQRWLMKLLDYVHISRIKAVPQNIGEYVCYFRPKVLPSKHVLIQRRMRRHHQTQEQAAQHYANLSIEHIACPFVRMRSHTKKEAFRLCIAKRVFTETLLGESVFNCYGLSREARLPHF